MGFLFINHAKSVVNIWAWWNFVNFHRGNSISSRTSEALVWLQWHSGWTWPKQSSSKESENNYGMRLHLHGFHQNNGLPFSRPVYFWAEHNTESVLISFKHVRTGSRNHRNHKCFLSTFFLSFEWWMSPNRKKGKKIARFFIEKMILTKNQAKKCDERKMRREKNKTKRKPNDQIWYF